MKIMFAVLLVCFAAGSASEIGERPFSEKLIYSETPEIGKNWHGGIRMNDILIWDMYLNVSGWFTLDLLTAGMPNLFREQGGTLKDNFLAFSIKSLPFSTQIKGMPYKLGGGIKFYSARSEFGDSTTKFMDTKDGSVVLFATQSYRWNRHGFNLFTSFSSHEDQDKTTYFIIPGYSYSIGESWRFSIEYYMTNTRFIPFKILQFAFDKDKLEFDNSERDMYSFMFFGFQYLGTHLRVDLNLASHYTFQNLILPMIGVGWNF